MQCESQINDLLVRDPRHNPFRGDLGAIQATIQSDNGVETYHLPSNLLGSLLFVSFPSVVGWN